MEIDDRDAAGNEELARIMRVLLPDLHQIFDRIGTKIKEGAAPEDLPITQWAADYRFWHDKSVEQLIRHYNTYELPLTVAERQKANPNAATNSAHYLTTLNVGEALGEYLQNQEFSAMQQLQFRRALHRVQNMSTQIDTTGVASIANRFRDGEIKGGGG